MRSWFRQMMPVEANEQTSSMAETMQRKRKLMLAFHLRARAPEGGGAGFLIG